MHDYEANFYLPFQGFAKPIYAIPGNHDWFDALEGFNANFLEPKAARAALQARVETDHGLTSTNQQRIERLMGEAARLRQHYAVNAGKQRAVFFELQTDEFALLAIDTGILRTIDERQWAWIERALERSRGKFIMAIVGHPRFAGGHDIPPSAEGGDVSGSSEQISLNASSPALAAETSANRLPAWTVINTSLQRIIAHIVHASSPSRR
jgi:hypothetical protein